MLVSWSAFSSRGVLSKKPESRGTAKKTSIFLCFSCQSMLYRHRNCCFRNCVLLCFCFSQLYTASTMVIYLHIHWDVGWLFWLSLVSLMISFAFQPLISLPSFFLPFLISVLLLPFPFPFLHVLICAVSSTTLHIHMSPDLSHSTLILWDRASHWT